MTVEEKKRLIEREKAVPIYNMRSQYGGYKPTFPLNKMGRCCNGKHGWLGLGAFFKIFALMCGTRGSGFESRTSHR